MLSPLNDMISPCPSTTSVGFERGLPYCPAIRAIRTAPFPVDLLTISPIWKSTPSCLHSRSVSQSMKRSAQSPPCTMKRSPRAAAASSSLSASTSVDCTSGGSFDSLSKIFSGASAASYDAICRLSRLRHEEGDHVRAAIVALASDMVSPRGESVDGGELEGHDDEQRRDRFCRLA